MSEPASWKKFVDGLFGTVNYLKVLSLAIKVAIIAIAVLTAVNAVDRFIPKKQTAPPQQITASPSSGGEVKITNIYNKEKNWAIGPYGDYNSATKDFRIGGIILRFF